MSRVMEIPTPDCPHMLKVVIEALFKDKCLKNWQVFDDNLDGDSVLKLKFTKLKSDASGEVLPQSWIMRSDKQTRRSNDRKIKHLDSQKAQLMTRSKTKDDNDYQHIELPRDLEIECASEQVLSPVMCDTGTSPEPDPLIRDTVNTSPDTCASTDKQSSYQPSVKSTHSARDQSRSRSTHKKPNQCDDPSLLTYLVSEKNKLTDMRDKIGRKANFNCDNCKKRGPLPYIDCCKIDLQFCYDCYTKSDNMLKHQRCYHKHMIWQGKS